jgi:hypothetical protein
MAVPTAAEHVIPSAPAWPSGLSRRDSDRVTGGRIGQGAVHLCLIVAATVAAAACGTPSARAEAVGCRAGISRQTTERLYAALNHLPAEADCAFDGVSTNQSTLEAHWSRGGTALPPLRVVPVECAPASARRSGPFVVEIPPEIGTACPSVVASIDAFVEQVAGETPVGRSGSEHDPLFRIAQALFAGIALLAAVLLVRGVGQRHRLDRRWVGAGIATFAAALVVRAALPFSLGNWYSEVLPAAGPPPWMRFGPGYFAFQSLLRDAGVWGPRTLVWSQLLIGAAALPLFLGVLREVDLGLDAAAAALVLLVFAPFHARLSATASEHVLASTLCLGLLLAWLRAAHGRDWTWFALALLLFPAVCVTRVDMAVQATLVLAWPFLSDRGEGGGRRRPPAVMVALLLPAALTTLAVTYQWISLPSHHPMPEPTGYAFALRYFLPQFWRMATNDPAWFSLSAVLLAMLGAPALAVRRPLLFVRVAGTLLAAFVVLGRTFLHDELLGARYFLFTIPIFLIASGYGFATVAAIVPRRHRPAAVAAGIVALALWTGVAARSAYAARYAFQDEYAFARAALARLPAGCAVYQVPLRGAALPHDVDCCLDVPRSPLVLDFPALRLLDLPDEPGLVSDSGCVAYYEGVACEITRDAGGALAEQAAEYFQTRCAEARRWGRLELLADAVTSARSTEELFDGRHPHARVYRWTAAADREAARP